jgi:hypothetical protein
MRALAGYAFIALSAMACGGSPAAPSPEVVTMAFRFAGDAQGWTPGFSDYSPASAPLMELTVDYRPLPPPLDPSQSALFMSAKNLSEDLFMYYKRQVLGLSPDIQ